MAKGEKTFNSSQVEKKKRTYEPFPPGEYDLKVLGDTVEIRKAEPSKKNPTPVSYVSCGFEALGTGVDGGKNKRVYHNFFCKMEPGKDGIVTPECADQIKGFADALGAALKASIVEESGIEVISQLAVKKFIEAHDGDVVRAHVGIQKGTKDYPDPKNVIKEFIESEGNSGREDEDEDEEDTDEEDEKDTDEDNDDEDSDDDADDEDDDEDDLKAAVSKKKAKSKSRK